MALYFERQESALCGRHCLNNLLQAPMFEEFQLAEIAHELDAKEKAAMMEMGVETPDFLKYIAVLQGALALFELEAVSWKGARVTEVPPEYEQGFICNFEHHWFALRCVGGLWYNLDSMLKEPEPITTTYLSLLLQQLLAENYSIFAVRGVIPDPSALR